MGEDLLPELVLDVKHRGNELKDILLEHTWVSFLSDECRNQESERSCEFSKATQRVCDCLWLVRLLTADVR